jgi:hypothetical protein
VRLDQARTAADESVVGGWGTPVALAQALPGDILELQDYEVRVTTLHTAHFDDGTRRQRSEQSSRTFAHHIAIIAARPNEHGVAVLEQVARSEPCIERRTCLLRDSGPIVTHVFQHANDEANRLRPATVMQRTNLRVTGSARAFRPLGSSLTAMPAHKRSPARGYESKF